MLAHNGRILNLFGAERAGLHTILGVYFGISAAQSRHHQDDWALSDDMFWGQLPETTNLSSAVITLLLHQTRDVKPANALGRPAGESGHLPRRPVMIAWAVGSGVRITSPIGRQK
jgi:hypothetical protein